MPFRSAGADVYWGPEVGGGCWFIEMRDWLWIELNASPAVKESRCKRRHPTGPHRDFCGAHPFDQEPSLGLTMYAYHDDVFVDEFSQNFDR
jgi:hypothetical protein